MTRWNPIVEDSYAIIIRPRSDEPGGVSLAAMEDRTRQILKAKRTRFVDERQRSGKHEPRGVEFYIEDIDFEGFRELVHALDVRGFHGRLDIADGSVAIEYLPYRRRRKKAERLSAARKKAKGGERRKLTHAFRRALRGL
jgi:hypothetical protein